MRAGEFASAREGEQLMFDWDQAVAESSASTKRDESPESGKKTGTKKTGIEKTAGAEKMMDAINARFKDSVRPASFLKGPAKKDDAGPR